MVEVYRAKRSRDPNVKNAPYIGTKKPVGWRRVRVYFVDSSGFGSDREPAMTFKQFVYNVKMGRGYAIISRGQFQVYVAEYVKKKKTTKRRKK